MNSSSTNGLTQQWIVVTDERGASLLVAKWVPDTEFGADDYTAS